VEERFERLLREHGPAIGRLALAYAGNAADAEDLCQEIWLGAWRALPGYRGDCSERTFVFRIGHNRGLTFRARRRPAGCDLDAARAVADVRPTPDVVAEGSAIWQRVLAGVRVLPPGLRQVVVLRLEGLGNQEIAQVTGLTESNVAVRLHRARARLKAALESVEVIR
jgi:RNA polymerase sigma-70 factor (ECF subfamily)